MSTFAGALGGRVGFLFVKFFVLVVVLPILGNIIAVVLFLSSMPAVFAARSSGDNGKLNSLPFSALLAQGRLDSSIFFWYRVIFLPLSAICWVIYGVMTNNVGISPINLV